jgi:hypothetical protein
MTMTGQGQQQLLTNLSIVASCKPCLVCTSAAYSRPGVLFDLFKHVNKEAIYYCEISLPLQTRHVGLSTLGITSHAIHNGHIQTGVACNCMTIA